MGMSTLAVKPRDRVRRRAEAAGSDSARPRVPVSGGSFPKPGKQLGSRRRNYGLGEGNDTSLGHAINDSSASTPRRGRDRRVAGLPESHTSRISVETDGTSPNFTALGANSFRRGTRSGGFMGGLGHVDYLVCGDGGIAEGHGTRSKSGAGEDRRGPQALRRLLSSESETASVSSPP